MCAPAHKKWGPGNEYKYQKQVLLCGHPPKSGELEKGVLRNGIMKREDISVTFLGIYGFSLYCWCQCGLLDHYRYGVMQVAIVISCVVRGGCWTRPLEHASLIAQSVQESQCVRM